jgi:hypothetical protein
MEEPMTITRIQCIVVNLVLFILFGFAVSASADSMKIAVATTGPGKTADISQQAGRSLFFLFFSMAEVIFLRRWRTRQRIYLVTPAKALLPSLQRKAQRSLLPAV